MSLTKEDRKDGQQLAEMIEKLTPEERAQAVIYISALSDRKMIADQKNNEKAG